LTEVTAAVAHDNWLRCCVRDLGPSFGEAPGSIRCGHAVPTQRTPQRCPWFRSGSLRRSGGAWSASRKATRPIDCPRPRCRQPCDGSVNILN